MTSHLPAESVTALTVRPDSWLKRFQARNRYRRDHPFNWFYYAADRMVGCTELEATKEAEGEEKNGFGDKALGAAILLGAPIWFPVLWTFRGVVSAKSGLNRLWYGSE